MKTDRFILLLSILTLLISAVLISVYLDIIREYIVVPIYSLLEIFAQIICSLPQTGFLIALVVICIFTAIFCLLEIHEPVLIFCKPNIPAVSRSRYKFWLLLCQYMGSSIYSLKNMSSELRLFLLNVLAYQEHKNRSEMESMIIAGSFDVPTAVRDLIINQCLGDPGEPITKKKPFSRFRERLFMLRRPPVESKINQQVEYIISYLEDRLEVHRD